MKTLLWCGVHMYCINAYASSFKDMWSFVIDQKYTGHGLDAFMHE